MKQNKIYQPEQITVKRSQINFAEYNPRHIDEDARRLLKKNLKEVGLLGGIIWNKRTGNLVSGHQRVGIMDSVNRYDPKTNQNDYEFRCEVVDWPLKKEKEQNLFMNNRKVQGEFDDIMLRDMLKDIDYRLAGFDDFDIEMLGIGDFKDIELPSLDDMNPAIQMEDIEKWKKEYIVEDGPLAQHDRDTKKSSENKKLDRSTDFYRDTKENQIARHNEVQKIKDRISGQNDIEKDGGALSYVVISFNTPSQKENFMEMFGYPVGDKYINGEEFQERLEFGRDKEAV